MRPPGLATLCAQYDALVSALREDLALARAETAALRQAVADATARGDRAVDQLLALYGAREIGQATAHLGTPPGVSPLVDGGLFEELPPSDPAGSYGDDGVRDEDLA